VRDTKTAPLDYSPQARYFAMRISFLLTNSSIP
jgi:hypothetical protein